MSLLTGILAYWQFEEASGNVIDSVNSYVGVPTSVTYSAAGIKGNCLSYNGTSSQVVVSTNFPKPTTAYSISFWIKTTDATSNKKVLYAYDSDYGFIMYYAGSTAGKISLFMGDGTNTIEGELSTAVNSGNWTHCVFTFDGTDFLGYVNNSQCLTDTWAYDVAWTGVDQMSFMSIDGNGYVNGSLDELGFWNRALTSGEVSDLYNGGAGLTYPFATYAGVLYCYNGSIWESRPLANYAPSAFTAHPLYAYYGGKWNLIQSF